MSGGKGLAEIDTQCKLECRPNILKDTKLDSVMWRAA